MGKIIMTKVCPKRYSSSIEVDCRDFDMTEQELFEWIKNTLSGDVYWCKCKFRDKNAPRRWPAHYQKKFKDEVDIFKFWIVKPADALMIKLMFHQNH